LNLTYFQKLGAFDTTAFRHHIESINGGYDTEVEGECPFCGQEFTFPLEFGEDFFIPARKKSG